MKTSILIFIFILFIFDLSSIEVGGHIIEDTTWSPDNNPYEVMEMLYVDSGVTLTVLPGTEIKVNVAPCTNWMEQSENFWLHNGVSVAKMFWVDGKIIAEGTEQDSILFTRLQDDPDYYWGNIYITEQAEFNRFEYCKFEYSAGIGIALGNIADAAISIYNGFGLIKNCTFINDASGIVTRTSLTKKIEVSSNIFTFDNNINNYVLNLWMSDLSISKPADGFKPGLIADNIFDACYITSPSFYYVNNTNNNSDVHIGNSSNNYIYNNCFYDLLQGIHGGYPGDSIYIKKNNFIGGNDGIDIDEAYIEISDNYFEGCNLDTGLECSGKIYNNVIKNGNVRTSAYLEVFQNIGYNGYAGITITYRNVSCYNNTSYNNEYAFDGVFSDYYNNCIFLCNNEISQNGISGNPIFRNCIIDFPLDPPLVDGGGNIIVDSLQAQLIFEDIQNGDFHLVPGSIAIDAGFDTLGYYYPFDIDYNHRVWDGDGNGTAIIDIGPYEYSAPALGGIQGITYDPTNGDFVNYVLIKINNESGEFTFSDSVGNYEYKLPAGVYDVYAERVFYNDAVEYQIEVIDDQFTQLDIPMCETVDVDEHEIPNFSFQISNLTNYPNPFNPETTIEFSIQNNSKVDLTIYNIKGQKVISLINEQLQKGKHSIIWSGCDQNGHQVSSGIYLYKIKAGNQESTKRMLLLK